MNKTLIIFLAVFCLADGIVLATVYDSGLHGFLLGFTGMLAMLILFVIEQFGVSHE